MALFPYPFLSKVPRVVGRRFAASPSASDVIRRDRRNDHATIPPSSRARGKNRTISADKFETSRITRTLYCSTPCNRSGFIIDVPRAWT